MRSASACMADIGALAGQLGSLATGQIESLLQAFVDNGEDRALSRLLQVCALNGVKLDPIVLCGMPRGVREHNRSAPLLRAAG